MVALQDQPGYSGFPQICKKRRSGSRQGVESPDSVLVDECLKYLQKLRILPWFNEFLVLMKGLKMETIPVTTMVDKMQELLQGNPELIQGFNYFLPPKYKIPTPDQSTPESDQSPDSDQSDSDVLQKAIVLVNKIKERFDDDDGGEDVYTSFLRIFSDVRRKRHKKVNELRTYKKVTTLFKGHKDLIQDLTQFLTQLPSTSDMIQLFPNCEICTPSYTRLPDDFPIPTATGRQEDHPQVLNDRYVSFPVKGSEVKDLSERESELFECEQDRFLIDLELERVKSASKRIKYLLAEIETKRLWEIHIEDYLSQIDLACIRGMKDHKRNHKMIDWLKTDARNSLPVILERLEERKQELHFLFDVEYLERVKSALKRIKVLLKKIETKGSSVIGIEGYLSKIDLMCIMRMKDHKMIDWLMEDAPNALPVILEGLEKKKQELESSWEPKIKKMLDDPSYIEILKHQNSLLPQKN